MPIKYERGKPKPVTKGDRRQPIQTWCDPEDDKDIPAWKAWNDLLENGWSKHDILLKGIVLVAREYGLEPPPEPEQDGDKFKALYETLLGDLTRYLGALPRGEYMPSGATEPMQAVQVEQEFGALEESMAQRYHSLDFDEIVGDEE